MSTSLDQLKASGTVVVADTGDFECAYFSFKLLPNLKSSLLPIYFLLNLY